MSLLILVTIIAFSLIYLCVWSARGSAVKQAKALAQLSARVVRIEKQLQDLLLESSSFTPKLKKTRFCQAKFPYQVAELQQMKARWVSAPAPHSSMSSFTSKATAPSPTRKDSAAISAMSPYSLPSSLEAAFDWFLSNYSVARIGVVVLFFGVAFLLKYSAEHSLMTIQSRLVAVGLAGLMLLALGIRLHKQRKVYAEILQGAGIGMAYLATYAATRLYTLLPEPSALALLLLLCMLAVTLALLQNALPLAFMGSVGGFLAPMLIASEGNPVALFGYYTLLNAGILTIAWFKAWRSLNLLGFISTFLLGSVWGLTQYSAALRTVAEFFLILFFLMYTGIALLYAFQRQIKLQHYVDGSLVFGTPLVAMGLQSKIMSGIQYGTAWSALALSLFYLAAWSAMVRGMPHLKLLRDAMLVLSIVFATLAIPLAFDGNVSSTLWAVEGAALAWLSIRQRRSLALICALLLQIAAGLAYLFDDHSAMHYLTTAWPMLNHHYIGSLLLAGAGIFSGYLLQNRAIKHSELVQAASWGWMMACWGAAWWFWGGFKEIWRWPVMYHWSEHGILHALALWVILSAWLAHGIRQTLSWPLAGRPILALLPILPVLALFSSMMDTPSPLQGWGAAVWLLTLIAAWHLLWRQQEPYSSLANRHTLLLWTLWILLGSEALWRLPLWLPPGAWRWCAWASVTSMLLALLNYELGHQGSPLRRFASAYLFWGPLPLAALLIFWQMASLAHDATAQPLPYLPLLNPYDLTQLLALVVLGYWWRRLQALGLQPPSPLATATGVLMVFVWLNTMLLRTLHHWADIPYTLDDLAQSSLVQSMLSLFWSVLALIAMALATNRGHRGLWLIGSSLLMLTVLKLFTLDLSFLAGVARIVAFLGVGGLLLLIGYFWPLPPRKKQFRADENPN